MASNKFKSNIAEVSEDKCCDAQFDSGTTHCFSHNRFVSFSYTQMNAEPIREAAGTIKIVGKGLAQVPVNNEMIVEAYDHSAFSSNILAVRLLSNELEVLFLNSIKDHPGHYLLKKGTFEILSEYPLQNGLYPINISRPKRQN